MKKFLTLFLILTLGFSYSQDNIAWNRVDIYVPANQAAAYLEAMDEFYSNIDMPEGVSVSLVRYFYRPQDLKATHSIVFAGPVDGIIELRQIRSGEKYEEFYEDLNALDSEVIANSAGQSLIRINTDSERGNWAQSWQWRVDDQRIFATAFAELMSNFKSVDTYVALGSINQGVSRDGESHYIYSNQGGFAENLKGGPQNQPEIEAFEKFSKTVAPISTFLGTRTEVTMKTW
tara:strand:+ start:898 stop:1593 length:696 start_codon:yes stop_codon:yes gene_type:complete